MSLDLLCKANDAVDAADPSNLAVEALAVLLLQVTSTLPLKVTRRLAAVGKTRCSYAYLSLSTLDFCLACNMRPQSVMPMAARLGDLALLRAAHGRFPSANTLFVATVHGQSAAEQWCLEQGFSDAPSEANLVLLIKLAARDENPFTRVWAQPRINLSALAFAAARCGWHQGVLLAHQRGLPLRVDSEAALSALLAHLDSQPLQQKIVHSRVAVGPPDSVGRIAAARGDVALLETLQAIWPLVHEADALVEAALVHEQRAVVQWLADSTAFRGVSVLALRPFAASAALEPLIAALAPHCFELGRDGELALLQRVHASAHWSDEAALDALQGALRHGQLEALEWLRLHAAEHLGSMAIDGGDAPHLRQLGIRAFESAAGVEWLAAQALPCSAWLCGSAAVTLRKHARDGWRETLARLTQRCTDGKLMWRAIGVAALVDETVDLALLDWCAAQGAAALRGCYWAVVRLDRADALAHLAHLAPSKLPRGAMAVALCTGTRCARWAAQHWRAEWLISAGRALPLLLDALERERGLQWLPFWVLAALANSDAPRELISAYDEWCEPLIALPRRDALLIWTPQRCIEFVWSTLRSCSFGGGVLLISADGVVGRFDDDGLCIGRPPLWLDVGATTWLAKLFMRNSPLARALARLQQ
jgi:hypothetical protein